MNCLGGYYRNPTVESQLNQWWQLIGFLQSCKVL